MVTERERERSSDCLLEICDLHKSFGDVKAVDGLSFKVKKGELFAFLGVNGAGKSTTISIITGTLEKDSGTIKLAGKSVDDEETRASGKIGVVFQNSVLDGALTAEDNLYARAALYGICGAAAKARIAELAELFEFNDILRRKVGKLSGGQRRKIDVARAMLHSPELLILDEPTTGLDPLMRATFLDIIRSEHRRGKTIFMSSHSFDEMEKTCDKVALINDGHLIDLCDMDSIRNRPIRDFKIEFHSAADLARFRKEGYEAVRVQEHYDQITIRIRADETAALLDVLKNYDLKFISELPYTLEMHFKQALLANREKETDLCSVRHCSNNRARRTGRCGRSSPSPFASCSRA